MLLFLFSLLFVVHSQSDLRPKQKKFVSQIIEDTILKVSNKIVDQKLKYTFINSLPNTLDTTVYKFAVDSSGKPDSFIITGDIQAMWLRDSTNQLWSYIEFIDKDPQLKLLTKGLINRQISQVIWDPFANAFNLEPKTSEWYSDNTTRCFLGINTPAMSKMLHERKFETDSLSAVLRLVIGYNERTQDSSIFDFNYLKALKKILQTFRLMQQDHEEQETSSRYPYTFQRATDRTTDTVIGGIGLKVYRTGLIRTFFRASDDSTIYQFNIPENAMASCMLNQTAEILKKTKLPWIVKFAAQNLIDESESLGTEIRKAIYKYGIEDGHFVYELNGKDFTESMDDSNQPSLLSLPIYGFIGTDDPLYIKTREFVLSYKNIFYFQGSAAKGIGGPHIGISYIWPMAIATQGLTSTNRDEIKECLRMLVTTTGDKWMMHESFHKNNATDFTRAWFAWANGLFGEFVLMVNEKYPELLQQKYDLVV